MLEMVQKVCVGQKELEIPVVRSVWIERSWKTIADTAVLELPAADIETGKSLAEVMPQGTPVSIDLGYRFVQKEYLNREFEGYVKRFHRTNPIRIELEDSAWLLRKKRVAKAFKDTTLRKVISFLIEGTDIQLSADIPEVRMTSLRLSNINAFDALRQLQEEYALTVYFRGKTLYAGLAFTELIGDVRYRFDGNIISENLSFRSENDESILLEAKGILPNNTTIKVEVGDKNGVRRTWATYNAKDKASLTKMAEEELERMRIGRYEGGVKTWLLPYVTFGMTAHVEDPDYPDKEGSFIVDQVTTTFSSSGGRREVKFGKKVS